MISVPHATMRLLSRTAGSASPQERIQQLRQAGYEGGAEMAQAFERRLTGAGDGKPDELPLEQFNARVAEFFDNSGWGRLATSSIHDVVASVDVSDCWEARVHGSAAIPCCHITTGAMAAFFSSFAPFPVAVIEVECAAVGKSRCRFLLGAPEVLNELYERLERGEDYAVALGQLSETSASA